MTPIPADLLVAVERWIALDPDPDTVAEARQLVKLSDVDGLQDRFGSRLAFGTAGLRGPIACGPNRMNRLVVRQTAAGLGRRILDDGSEYAARGVVVGFDARHKSDAFASDTAQVLAAMGIRVYLFRHIVATPVLAFSVLHLGCAAGVQVTASHNPPADNGYKVYWGDGPQIVSPLDEQISAHIDAVADDPHPVTLASEFHPMITFVDESVIDDYHAGVRALDVHSSSREDRASLKIVYTALHGVGAVPILRTFDDAGFTDFHPVVEQRDPDPDFSTVAFPNPEEPGALDLSIALAQSIGAHIVLANDPDADRMSAAIPDARSSTGWRQLRGDEVGWLLADHLLTLSDADGPDRLVATTIVSSSLLETMAARHGVQYRETLTGFKWLARNAISLPQYRHVISYEEALGYSIGALVRDKDGISAALVFADLAAALKARGSSLSQRLAEIEAEYGRYDTSQWALRFDGADALSKMADLMSGLRAHLPASVAGIAVTHVRDLATSEPSADVVILTLGPVGRITVRPSGTEPKCKVYFEVVSRGDASPVSIKALRNAMAEVLGVDPN